MRRRLFPAPPVLIAPVRKLSCKDRLSVTAVGILVFPALTLGCSQPQKPVEEVDWGQPRPSAVRQAPRREPHDDRRKAPVDSESTSGTRHGGRGGDDSGASATGDADDGGNSGNGGKARGSQVSDGSPVTGGAGQATGNDGDGPGGISDTSPPVIPDNPKPAFPGREPGAPPLSAKEAADSARQLLKQAQQLLRAADRSAAAATAIEAYDQVIPHAESSKECKKLARQLEAVLTSTGRRQGPADDVETRFE
jgi:hypothetical protein